MRVGSTCAVLAFASSVTALAFDPRILVSSDTQRRASVEQGRPIMPYGRRIDCIPGFCPSDSSSAAGSSSTPAVLSSTTEVRSSAAVTPSSSTAVVPTSTPPRSSATPTSTSATPTSTPRSSSATPTSSSTQQTSSTTPSSSSSQSSSADVSTSFSVVSIATTDSATSTSSSAATSSTAAAATSTNTDSGGNTGTIVGLSVAGGVGALIVIGFIVWKLKKKRFSDFDDDDGAAIRWPELDGASAMHPLPARQTGRSGVETSALDQDEAFDGRGYADASTSDLPLQLAGGPYSNPAPGAHDQYYYDNTPHQSGAVAVGPGYDAYGRPLSTDPYGGALDGYGKESGTYEHGGSYEHGGYGGYDDPGYGAGNNRTTSPGPHSAYGAGGASMRSASPGVNNAYANFEGHQGQRTTSPGPEVSYGYR